MKVRDNIWKRYISNNNVRNPFTGQLGNPHMSFEEDAAIIHKMATLGVFILDPTRTISLIPAVLNG
jgi:hypothetical protein